jgi:hypothetical protein
VACPATDCVCSTASRLGQGRTIRVCPPRSRSRPAQVSEGALRCKGVKVKHAYRAANTWRGGCPQAYRACTVIRNVSVVCAAARARSGSTWVPLIHTRIIMPAARPSVDLCEMIGAYLVYIMVDCYPQGCASKLMYPARRDDFAATIPRLVARAQTNSSKYWERRRACALRPRDCRGRGSNADLRATAR